MTFQVQVQLVSSDTSEYEILTTPWRTANIDQVDEQGNTLLENHFNLDNHL
jgi:hypothetical protein